MVSGVFASSKLPAHTGVRKQQAARTHAHESDRPWTQYKQELRGGSTVPAHCGGIQVLPCGAATPPLTAHKQERRTATLTT